MEKRAFLLGGHFLLLFLFFGISCQQENSRASQNYFETFIEARPFIYLENIGTEFKISRSFLQAKLFHITDDLITYLIDSERHRVLEIDMRGHLKNIIGGPGQRENDLYYPVAVTANDKVLAVVNDSGREIKIFDRSGKFLKLFSKDDIHFQPFILSHKNNLIVPIRKATAPLEEKNKSYLFSLLDQDFAEIRHFGQVIKCSTPINHIHFNLIELTVGRKAVYGSFINLPIIFAYDLNSSREIFWIDLSQSEIPEISSLTEKIKQLDADTPMKQKAAGNFRVIRFNRGLSFYANKIFYLTDEIFLIFNLQGNLTGRIKIMLNKNIDLTPAIDSFTILPSGKIYGLAKHPESKQPFIFEAKI
ncbi:MAG: hypothetical protein WBI18_02195 [Candidatus Saccharicenans sp.]